MNPLPSHAPEFLFVYGTLARRADHPMSCLLRQHGEFVSPAYLHGRLYEIQGYPGAVQTTDNNEKVHGDLYRLKDNASWLLARLDDYEECSPAFAQPHEYIRKPVTVYSEQASSFVAWAYIYNHPVIDDRRIHSGDFFQQK